MIDTKNIFIFLLKALEPDCICDIGSRDGMQSVLFRDLAPNARVLAFEANPNNARDMRANSRLKEERIEVFEMAVADKEGEMDFFIAAPAGVAPQDEVVYGSSSLMSRVSENVQASMKGGVAKVRVRRLDDVIKESCPGVKRIALWIDAEGAEDMILQGMAGIVENVYAIHVETARRPLFQGQVLFPEIQARLEKLGFVCSGDSITEEAGWGDAVFVKARWANHLGASYNKMFWKARLTKLIKIHDLAVFLKKNFPALYRTGRTLYLKLS